MTKDLLEYDYDEPKPAKKILAKAIYENIAETTDELAFRKGDIVTVVDTHLTDSPGWWLCQSRGRQGICPENRLKIIEAHDSGIYSMSPASSPCPSVGQITGLSCPISQELIYENTTKHGKRRSWQFMPNKVLTPQKCGDVYLYDLLPSLSHSSSSSRQSYSSSENYDIPKPALPSNRTIRQCIQEMEDSYDIPRPVQNLLAQQNLTPSSSNSSLLTSDSLSLSSSNRSSLANMPDYDIPRKHPTNVRQTPPPPQIPPTSSFSQHSMSSITSSTYDVPQQTKKELPLELSSALEALASLQIEANAANSKLLGYISPNWRTKEKLEPVLMEIKLSVVRLRTALHDLTEFGEGALGNASNAEDKGLAQKLKPLVKALKDADKLFQETSHNLDNQGWSLVKLQRPEITQKLIQQLPPDNLDQLVECAKNLTDDVRQIVSFIQGNATLLFKKSTNTTASTPITPTSNKNGEWLDDYDYVSFENKEKTKKVNSENHDKEAPKNQEPLDPNDKSVLVYYASQTVTHMGYLTQAIDSFLQTVERNQPPKFFLAYGKFVVLSAHNLVNIGDIVHRNITRENIKSRVLQCADALSEGLKNCVAKTKKAAQCFPSVTAVQEMVDSVVDISHLACDLKIAMLHSVQQ